jgi:hypothetical protein
LCRGEDEAASEKQRRHKPGATAYAAGSQRGRGMIMTEAEWLACADPGQMLDFLRGKASDRKLRLFAVACCRRIRHQCPEEVNPRLWEACERYADGLTSAKELRAARRKKDNWEAQYFCAYNAAWLDAWGAAEFTAHKAASAVSGLPSCGPGLDEAVLSRVPDTVRRLYLEAREVQCGLLREMFTPFLRTSCRAECLRWNDRTVPKVAAVIYADRAFENLPILADALLDAGCDDEELMLHLRSPGPHVRGCWALDLVLGKR